MDIKNMIKYKAEEYSGSYKRIRFDISKKGLVNHQKHWTFYLHIKLNEIPARYEPNSFWLSSDNDESYLDHPIIKNISFHGECTFYAKKGGFDNIDKSIVIGCDYNNHLSDMKLNSYDVMEHTLDDIQRDVVTSIESFLKMIPNYGEVKK
jgi:hypothetical protein